MDRKEERYVRRSVGLGCVDVFSIPYGALVFIFGGKGKGMAVGRIKWFDDKRGYGFIEQEGGPDVFVHYSKITGEGYKTLEKGEEVEFETRQGEKGLHAENVIRTASGGA